MSKKEDPPLTNRRSNEAEHNGHQAVQNSQSQAQRNQVREKPRNVLKLMLLVTVCVNIDDMAIT